MTTPKEPRVSRRTWRLIVTGIAAVVLAGCQTTIAGSGHPAPDQAEPTTDTEHTEDTRLELVGDSSCEPDSPTARPGDGGSIESATVNGTGHGLDVQIDLTKQLVNDRDQDVGIEIQKGREVRDFGVLVLPGGFSYGYIYDPVEDAQRDLPNYVEAYADFVHFIIPGELIVDIGPEFHWYAYNVLDGAGDYCPPPPTNGGEPATVSFPAP